MLARIRVVPHQCDSERPMCDVIYVEAIMLDLRRGQRNAIVQLCDKPGLRLPERENLRQVDTPMPHIRVRERVREPILVIAIRVEAGPGAVDEESLHQCRRGRRNSHGRVLGSIDVPSFCQVLPYQGGSTSTLGSSERRARVRQVQSRRRHVRVRLALVSVRVAVGKRSVDAVRGTEHVRLVPVVRCGSSGAIGPHQISSLLRQDHFDSVSVVDQSLEVCTIS
mmetsp:Transcript_16207/g.32443  ORF Transcript_16207/g.32443 Transcript_16207/m.32443 type:complete len:223 (+) Transcript_16207:1327-1995(+)